MKRHVLLLLALSGNVLAAPQQDALVVAYAECSAFTLGAMIKSSAPFISVYQIYVDRWVLKGQSLDEKLFDDAFEDATQQTEKGWGYDSLQQAAVFCMEYLD